MKIENFRASRAFTLIELLVVMMLIAIMSAIVLGMGTYASGLVARSQTAAARAELVNGLEEYRALYGEYPHHFNNSTRHYPANYATECPTNPLSPWTNINLSVTNIQNMFVSDSRTPGAGSLFVDFSLTYPLVIAQKEQGREPFVSEETITTQIMAYLAFNYADEKQETWWNGPGQEVGGRMNYDFIGKPIYRYIAKDPVSGKQWKYTCLNGLTYTLELHP